MRRARRGPLRRAEPGDTTRDAATAIIVGRADRLIDAGVLLFAAFTLTANVTVALGGSLEQLTIAASVVAAAVLTGLFFLPSLARKQGPRELDGDIAADTSAETDSAGRAGHDGLSVAWQVSAAAIALTAAGHQAWTDSLVGVWLAAVVVACAVLVRSWPQPFSQGASVKPPRITRAQIQLVAVLALLCAVTVAVAHRADDDDAFYLNIAVAAADDPSAPLLANDTLHGYDDVPIDLPVFRVLSYELALATVSRLTGVDALVLAHVVFPPFAALLIPLAWTRLLRRLAPREWPWLLAGVVASFFLFADGRATHGEFALLRLQQGKSIFLVILWPLIAHAGLAFGARADDRRWLRLAASQIAAVGLTANALWLAPAVGGLGVVAGLISAGSGTADRPRHGKGPAILTLAFGALASFHAVGLSLILRAEMLRAFGDAAHPLPSLQHTSAELMTRAVEVVAGTGVPAALMLFATIVAAAIAPTRRLRVFMATFTLATCVLFWNPLWADFVATQITGPDTYFRVLWLWPVPVALSLMLGFAAAALDRSSAGGTAAKFAAFAVVATVSFALGGGVATPAPANDGVRLHAPSIKIAEEELALTRALTRYAGPGQFVLAPVAASRWLPLLHDHPHPLVVREMLLDVLDERLGQRELTLRAQLTRMVGGDVRLPHSGELLAHAIESVPLEAVALEGSARKWRDVRQALKASPLTRVEANDDFEIWARHATQQGARE